MPRLADVVEQRGEAGDPEVELAEQRRDVLDDGDRVAEDVLVAMDRVVLEAQRRQLGQELLGEPGVDEEPQAGRRAVDDDQLVQLVADPLGRHDRQPLTPLDHRGDQLRNGLEAEAGDEARRAEHAQWVVVEADLRRQRRAQRPSRQVGRTTVGIDERGVGSATDQLEGHRVDGEVTPAEVDLDLVGERDVRLARLVGVRLGAERGDLQRAHGAVGPLALGTDRPEPLPLRPHGVAPIAEQRLDLRRAGIRRQIEIVVLALDADKEVAHGAADEEQPMAGVGEPRRQGGELVEDRHEPGWDHRGRRLRAGCSAGQAVSGAHTLRTSSTAAAPGPPELGRSDDAGAPASVDSTAAAHADSASRS